MQKSDEKHSSEISQSITGVRLIKLFPAVFRLADDVKETDHTSSVLYYACQTVRV